MRAGMTQPIRSDRRHNRQGLAGWARLLGVALLSTVIAVLAGCSVSAPHLPAADRERVATGLEATLPAVGRLDVLLFQNDGCRALETSRGQFSDGPNGCGLFIRQGVAPFDAQAHSAWSELRDAFDRAGANELQYAVFILGADGAVDSAVFEFGCDHDCDFGRLIYTRGRSPDDPGSEEGPDVTNLPVIDGWDWYEEY